MVSVMTARMLATPSRMISRTTLAKSCPNAYRGVLARRASSLPNIPETLQSSPLFEKLRSSPIILSEIIKITTLFEQKGIQMNEKPSFTDMMKLARDSEIQSAMKNLKKVMDEEGVTLDIQDLLKNMPK